MKAKLYDKDGNEIDEDGRIVRDGQVVRLPMLLMDGGQQKTARQLLADRAAQVRSDIDRQVYAAHGMSVPAGQVTVLDGKSYLPPGQRAGTVALSDDIREAKQALVADYNSRLSSAWRQGADLEGE